MRDIVEIANEWRNYPPDYVYHPVMIDKVKRKKYIVVGQFYNKAKKRTCLCVFEQESDHFTHVDGFWEYEEQKLYLSNKFCEQYPIPARMTFIQRSCFNSHWMYRFIEEGVYIRDRDGNALIKLESKNQNNQTTMEL